MALKLRLAKAQFISPVAPVTQSPVPSDGTVEGAEEVVVPPRPRAKPVAACCCGAVDVRTEPKVRPGPAVEEVVAVVREKGVAEAVGLLKAKLNPVVAVVVAGAPESIYRTRGKKRIENK